VIEYKSLATVTLPDFVTNGIATSDVFGDDYYGDDHEANCDETVTVKMNIGHPVSKSNYCTSR
jgi:hypothetical protein